MPNHTTPDGLPVGDYQVSLPAHPSHHLRGYVPSAVLPHIEALKAAGIYETLDVETQGIVIKAMQKAYRIGKADAGAEKIDSDAVWVNGIGMIELVNGEWKVTTPDGSITTPAELGRKGGAATSEAKAAAARVNGKLGGRPRKTE